MSTLQLAILKVLWQRGEASVAQVQRDLLPERGLAHTTVATVLNRLAERDAVTRVRSGRRLLYRPQVSRADLRQQAVEQLVDGLFDGNAKALVTQLVRNGPLDADDLVRLGRMLQGE